MKKNKVKLSDVTTYKFGGTCNSYFEIDSEKQIQEFDFQNIDIDNIFVIGKGSNIVFSDNGEDFQFQETVRSLLEFF